MVEQEHTRNDVQEEKQKPKIEVTETSVPSLYINNATFSMTEWDIRIDLGEQHSVDVEKMTMFVVPRLRLIMTPGFAQRFLQTLHGVLEKRQQVDKEAETQEPQPPKEPIK